MAQVPLTKILTSLSPLTLVPLLRTPHVVRRQCCLSWTSRGTCALEMVADLSTDEGKPASLALSDPTLAVSMLAPVVELGI